MPDHGTSASRSFTGMTAAILLVWIAVLAAPWWHHQADDFTSTYIAARLLWEGNTEAYYRRDPARFDVVSDADWNRAGRHLEAKVVLHPIVQIPLAGYVLAPWSGFLTSIQANRLFLLVRLAEMAAAVVLACLLWNRALLKPLPLVLLLTLYALTEPLRFTLFQNQPHPGLLFGTMLAVYLVTRQRPVAAGLVLAFIAVIKVTPVILAPYWFFTGRRKAAFAAAGGMVAFVLGSLALGGWPLHVEFWHVLLRISGSTIIGLFNQSFRAWLLRSQLPLDEMFNWNLVPTPVWIKMTSTFVGLAVLALVAWKVWRDRRRGIPLPQIDTYAVPSLMLYALIFSPISWNHYFIVLIVPWIIFQRALVARPSAAGWIIFGLTVALNFRPIAVNAAAYYVSGSSFVWSHLLSAIMLLAVFLTWRVSARSEVAPAGQMS